MINLEKKNKKEINDNRGHYFASIFFGKYSNENYS